MIFTTCCFNVKRRHFQKKIRKSCVSRGKPESATDDVREKNVLVCVKGGWSGSKGLWCVWLYRVCVCVCENSSGEGKQGEFSLSPCVWGQEMGRRDLSRVGLCLCILYFWGDFDIIFG